MTFFAQAARMRPRDFAVWANPCEGNKPETEQFVFLLFSACCMVFKRQDGPVVIINTD